jgi:2-C-methyl-D-erythritol 4-phosphate cytidylyltransferase
VTSHGEADDAAVPTVAALLAGGTGTRLGAEVPKQLLRLAGKEILAHTLDVFDGCPAVDEIYLFMAVGHTADAEAIVAAHGYHKVRAVSVGGASRDASARQALAALAEYPPGTKLLIHDAVRPLVDAATITECVAALDDYDAVTVAVPSTDTIVTVTAGEDGREVIQAIPDRSRLRRCQTPQGFRLRVLAAAHARALADEEFTPTDDCGVVRRYLPQVPVGIVAGSEHNLKITHPGDLRTAEWLLQQRTL